MGPITFPVSTSWDGFGYEKGASVVDVKNWYYATGGFAYNLTGQVTVYPPETPGGEWRYVQDVTVNVRDRYNWDGSKSTQIGPFTVTDAQLQELHRAGLAQEYNMLGESSNRRSEGSG
jgi:hypothetical protein